ncbi:regulatory protein [Vibrio phage VFJ]|uniref:Regulatory protein n=1 Tax=Vibrio phage VFJ TaxID=1340745 RepID=R9TE55_9VIRU|nr:regulatory protein [Vibrio phage VFJ]AGN30006.1 regulatory protein [Vibrio phage VFJ]
MYQCELLNAYKNAQKYVQDKQIAMDMNIPKQRISDFRKGRRYLTDEQAIFLAESAGIDPEIALLGCHADRNENPRIKAIWESIAKKQNGLGLRTISMFCGGLAVSISQFNELISQCVLGLLMVNVAIKSDAYKTPDFGSFHYESKRNDKKFCFS